MSLLQFEVDEPPLEWVLDETFDHLHRTFPLPEDVKTSIKERIQNVTGCIKECNVSNTDDTSQPQQFKPPRFKSIKDKLTQLLLEYNANHDRNRVHGPHMLEPLEVMHGRGTCYYDDVISVLIEFGVEWALMQSKDQYKDQYKDQSQSTQKKVSFNSFKEFFVRNACGCICYVHYFNQSSREHGLWDFFIGIVTSFIRGEQLGHFNKLDFKKLDFKKLDFKKFDLKTIDIEENLDYYFTNLIPLTACYFVICCYYSQRREETSTSFSHDFFKYKRMDSKESGFDLPITLRHLYQQKNRRYIFPLQLDRDTFGVHIQKLLFKFPELRQIWRKVYEIDDAIVISEWSDTCRFWSQRAMENNKLEEKDTKVSPRFWNPEGTLAQRALWTEGWLMRDTRILDDNEHDKFGIHNALLTEKERLIDQEMGNIQDEKEDVRNEDKKELNHASAQSTTASAKYQASQRPSLVTSAVNVKNAINGVNNDAVLSCPGTSLTEVNSVREGNVTIGVLDNSTFLSRSTKKVINDLRFPQALDAASVTTLRKNGMFPRIQPPETPNPAISVLLDQDRLSFEMKIGHTKRRRIDRAAELGFDEEVLKWKNKGIIMDQEMELDKEIERQAIEMGIALDSVANNQSNKVDDSKTTCKKSPKAAKASRKLLAEKIKQHATPKATSDIKETKKTKNEKKAPSTKATTQKACAKATAKKAATQISKARSITKVASKVSGKMLIGNDVEGMETKPADEILNDPSLFNIFGSGADKKRRTIAMKKPAPKRKAPVSDGKAAAVQEGEAAARPEEEAAARPEGEAAAVQEGADAARPEGEAAAVPGGADAARPEGEAAAVPGGADVASSEGEALLR